MTAQEKPTSVLNISPKQRRKIRFYLELIFLAIVLLYLIQFYESLGGQDQLTISLRNSGHASVFLVATYVLVRMIYGNRQLSGWQCIKVFTLALSIGILIELIQPSFGRDSSIGDVVNDLLGISAAILIHQALRSGFANGKKCKLILSALLIVSLSLIVPAHYLWLSHKKTTLFPTLLDFESPWQTESLKFNEGADIKVVNAADTWLENTSLVGLIRISGGVYPGVAIREPSANWSHFNELTFDLFSKAAKPFTLVVRVHDRQHNSEFNDRFNMRLTMQPGFNTYTIPLEGIKDGPKSRKIDLTAIAGLTLFFVHPQEPFEFYLDNIMLK